MHRSRTNKGFSLVELLAVVLVLAALAAIAIPLYTSQRKSAQARVCAANIAAIGASLSAYALRQNAYPLAANIGLAWVAASNTGGLIGAPEGLSALPVCPTDGAAYTYTVTAGGACEIKCTNNAAAHAAIDTGAPTTSWDLKMSAPAADSLP